MSDKIADKKVVGDKGQLVVLRVKSHIKADTRIVQKLKGLGLTRNNTLAFVDDSLNPILIKIQSFIAWGVLNDTNLNKIKEKYGDSKIYHLPPPRKGYKSVRKPYPAGVVGNMGDDINKLIERMI